MNGFQDRTPPLEFRLACGPSVPLRGEEAGFPRSCPCYSETQVSPLYDGRGYNERRNRGDGPARHVRPRERTPRRARDGSCGRALEDGVADGHGHRLHRTAGRILWAAVLCVRRASGERAGLFSPGRWHSARPEDREDGEDGFARRVRPACRARSFRALLNAKPCDRHDSPGWRRATAPRFSALRDQVVRPRSHSSRWGPQTPG